MSLDAARIQWHISEQYPRMAYLTGKLLPNLSAGGLGCGGIKGPPSHHPGEGLSAVKFLPFLEVWGSQCPKPDFPFCFVDIICSLDQPALSSALRKYVSTINYSEKWTEDPNPKVHGSQKSAANKASFLKQSPSPPFGKKTTNSPALSQHRGWWPCRAS